MPEGDTLYKAAVNLRKALVGHVVTGFESTVTRAAAAAAHAHLVGRTVSAVEPVGKHLLMVFRAPAAAGGELEQALPAPLPVELMRSDMVLHTHLRMTGSWHIYRPGQPWQKPARYAVVVIHTDGYVTPCFSAPVVELISGTDAARHPDLISLGPDASAEQFDEEEVRTRMRRRPEVEIGVALLNQRFMAGVGNVFKSEVLFIRRVCPFLTVGRLTDADLDGLIEECRRLLIINRTSNRRITRSAQNLYEQRWVYGRSGEPCRICGTTVRMRRQGIDQRSTYYCPLCQHCGPP